MLGKRIINTATGAACTTDTVQILGDTSCVAYYKMNDATDETGSYDGTPTNVNFNVAGKFGNAGEFNGSSSVITLPSALSDGVTTNADCISFWFNVGSEVTSSTASNEIMSFAYSGGSTGKIALGSTAGALTSETFSVSSDITTQYTYSTTNIPAGWNHAVVQWNSGTTKWDIYINGVAQTTYTFGTNEQGKWALKFGQRSSFYYDGLLDQVRIFNRAITANEVTTLYNEVYCQPTIVPTDNFNTVTWDGEAGNGSRDFSGVGFQPDLVWAKRRSSVDDHHIYDSARGAGSTKVLASNKTAAEPANNAATYGYLDAFLSDGFSTVSGSANNAFFNENNQSFVAWNWKAGGAAVTNTDGTITSQVSANQDAGFSIVKYDGTGVSGSYGHGLLSACELIITKNIDWSTPDWFVYHKDLAVNGYLRLSQTTAEQSASTLWASAPSTTVVNIGNDSGVNRSTGDTQIAYCFHSVDGMSKIGSYVGTGAVGTPNIVTGFRPAMIIAKRTDAGSSNWFIWDNKRDVTNPNGTYLLPNASNAENNLDAYGMNFHSNGFSVNSSDVQLNASGGTYIYMAFAEEVFNPNGVTRNATNPFGDASELALYKFEDNANDAEGSYNGTASNVTYATGYIDKAAVFNGSSSFVRNYTTAFNFPTASTFSISAWFKLNTLSGFQQIISNFSGNVGWGLRVNDGGFLAFNSNAVVVISSTQLQTNTWYHATFVGNAGSGELFLNGSSQGTGNYSFSYISGNNGLRIGVLGDLNVQYFNGSIDQVRIFNRALDSGEVTQLYNE